MSTVGSTTAAAVSVGPFQPVDVASVLKLTYGENVIERSSLIDPTGTCTTKNPHRQQQQSTNTSNNNGKSAAQIKREEQEVSARIKQQSRHAPEGRKGLCDNTPLWFVPNFHPIEIVGMSASPETKEMFCSVKITRSGNNSNSSVNEQTEESASASRIVIVSVAEVRRRFPQLLIDYLLCRSLYDQ